MATITLEVPDEISVAKIEAKLYQLASSMGLKARYGGHRRIKLLQPSPNAVAQTPRLVAATPNLMGAAELRKLPRLPGDANEQDALAYTAGAGDLCCD